MPLSHGDPARAHCAALHRLQSFIAVECPDRTTYELLRRLRRVFETFQRFRSPAPADAPVMSEGLEDPAIQSNYVLAQCSILLAFVNQLEASGLRTRVPELDHAMSAVAVELDQSYALFFHTARPVSER